MYPAKLAYFMENILCFVILSTLVIYVASWPGVIGIALVSANLFFRFLFKRIINKMDKDLGVITNLRVKTTIEIFNIIKFIKANALESCYFNKLRGLRLEEVAQLKEKLFLEMVQNIIVMVSKPIIVVLVVKLIILFGTRLTVQVLFTVNLSMIIINMQAILNALAYVDLIQVALTNIEEFLQEEELDLSHVEYTNNSSSNVAITIENGNFYWDGAPEKPNNDDNNEPQPPSDEKRGSHLKNINLEIQRG
jgi:ABC-type multidrug transport system fused ATPase/permease subunit